MPEPGHGAGTTLTGLLTNPDQFAARRADPGNLLPRAIDEGLRRVAAIGTMMRSTTRDTHVSGPAIPNGTPISLIPASANRDEARFADPDAFNPHRPPTAQMSFASGAHFCAGNWFAKARIDIARRVLLAALPDLSLTKPPVFNRWRVSRPDRPAQRAPTARRSG